MYITLRTEKMIDDAAVYILYFFVSSTTTYYISSSTSVVVVCCCETTTHSKSTFFFFILFWGDFDPPIFSYMSSLQLYTMPILLGETKKSENLSSHTHCQLTRRASIFFLIFIQSLRIVYRISGERERERGLF